MAVRAPKMIIIGGGLAGPVLALSLKRQGISSTVFELRNRDVADGGFLALAPNALRVLDHIGIYDKIVKQGYNYEELHFLSGRNLSMIGLVNNGSEKKYGYKALRIGRGIVRQTLLASLGEENIELHYGAGCVDIKETAEGKVTVYFANGHVEHGDFVIGADGIHSSVRKFIDPNVEPSFSGQIGLGGQAERSKLGRSSQETYMPCIVLGAMNSFAVMPVSYSGDRIGFFATIEEKDRSREEWSKMSAQKRKLAETLQKMHCGPKSDWPQLVHDVCKEVQVESMTVWPYYSVPKLDSWTSKSGKIILIGDAAHAIPPTGGQGAAMAFEDAATLASAFSQSTNEQSIANWQAHRQARTEKVTSFTAKSGDMRKATPTKFQQILKEWVMWVYFWVKGRDGGLGWVYSYKTEECL